MTPTQTEDRAWFWMWMFLFLLGCAGAIADPFLGWPHPYTAVIFGWLACSGPAMAYGRSEVVAGRTPAGPSRLYQGNSIDPPIRKWPCGCARRVYQDQTIRLHCSAHCPKVAIGEWEACAAHSDGTPPSLSDLFTEPRTGTR